MCGIFLYISHNQIKGSDKKCLCEMSSLLKHRGPDQTKVSYYSDNVMIGFHRLAIMDPTPTGIQPFMSVDGRFVSITNGEIYNFREIRTLLDSQSEEEIEGRIEGRIDRRIDRRIDWKTHSDCEVIVHLFSHFVNQVKETEQRDDLFALKSLCDTLDGEYSLIIYDHQTERVYFATDELSMRPLFLGRCESGYFLSSEHKPFSRFGEKVLTERIPASTCGYIDYKTNTVKKDLYCDLGLQKIISIDFEEAVLKIRQLLVENTVKKLSPDREFVFLLSGGLDSSLVCSIAARELHPIRIKTFAVGFSQDATDIIAARKVAKHIDSIHTEIICDFSEGTEQIPFVIYHNESWDQTTTRASVPMSLCLKKIREKYPDVAVVFSGEVADELFRGYLYNRKSPSPEEGRKDQIMRLKNIHTSDGIRADRTCASYSFECRFPFFGKDLIKFVLSLPPEYCDPKANQGIEKAILRKAFSLETGAEIGDPYEYLPREILWRTKNAMSDATSLKSGWKDHVKRFCDREVSDSRFGKRETLYPYCTPQTKEDMYYREIFDQYGFEETTIPFKWMSSWCDPNATDSSATVIDVFEEDQME